MFAWKTYAKIIGIIALITIIAHAIFSLLYGLLANMPWALILVVFFAYGFLFTWLASWVFNYNWWK